MPNYIYRDPRTAYLMAADDINSAVDSRILNWSRNRVLLENRHKEIVFEIHREDCKAAMSDKPDAECLGVGTCASQARYRIPETIAPRPIVVIRCDVPTVTPKLERTEDGTVRVLYPDGQIDRRDV